MRKDTTAEPSEREIIIGDTARELAAPFGSYMGSGGWCVRTDGERIIIEGATSEALREAAEHLISSLKKNSNGEIVFMHTDTKTERKTDELAAANLTLTVATFNIQNGGGVGHDMARLAELITPLGIDIIGLQEVDVGTSRAGGKDTLRELAEAAGYEYYAFSRAIDYRGGQYGTAIMSKYPIKSYETVSLTTPEGLEARVYGHAVIDVGGVSIDFYNTHLSYEDTDVRLTQIAELNAAVSRARGFIVTGDFNTDDNTQRAAIGGTLTNTDKYATFPSSGKDIDDIILHGGWDILDSDMVEVLGKSDHNLLWAKIKFVG
jgi:endonuclease/exonuclease/phosphatase family metal-dependent hydrolase